ncbi:MAG: hypothetical protein HWN80_08115 [Candidatus Lokiarchaeota archaeon]|nr:hypothetical protein [Candidatus Lokiarchaeota archaeon]
MRTGKIFCIIGGLLVLVATYLLTFSQFHMTYTYGLGLIQNLGFIFGQGDIVDIIIAILFVIFLFSGFLLVIGVKSRATAIIGSFLAIGMSVYILYIHYYGIFSVFFTKFLFFTELPLVDGIYPLHIAIDRVGLGTYVLLSGGVIGLIGGILGTSS